MSDFESHGRDHWRQLAVIVVTIGVSILLIGRPELKRIRPPVAHSYDVTVYPAELHARFSLHVDQSVKKPVFSVFSIDDEPVDLSGFPVDVRPLFIPADGMNRAAIEFRDAEGNQYTRHEFNADPDPEEVRGGIMQNPSDPHSRIVLEISRVGRYLLLVHQEVARPATMPLNLLAVPFDTRRERPVIAAAVLEVESEIIRTAEVPDITLAPLRQETISRSMAGNQKLELVQTQYLKLRQLLNAQFGKGSRKIAPKKIQTQIAALQKATRALLLIVRSGQMDLPSANRDLLLTEALRLSRVIPGIAAMARKLPTTRTLSAKSAFARRFTGMLTNIGRSIDSIVALAEPQKDDNPLPTPPPASVVPVCGDGIAEGHEECDDGRHCFRSLFKEGEPCTTVSDCGEGPFGLTPDCIPKSEDKCSTQCKNEYCGDGITQKKLGEECDRVMMTCNQGTNHGRGCLDDGDCPQGACSATRNLNCDENCKNFFCGNGKVELWEECDPGRECLTSENSIDDCSDEDSKFLNNDQLACDPRNLTGSKCCIQGFEGTPVYTCNYRYPGECELGCKRPVCGDGISGSVKEQCDYGLGIVAPPQVEGADPENQSPVALEQLCKDCRFLCGDGFVDSGYGEECEEGSICRFGPKTGEPCSHDPTICGDAKNCMAVSTLSCRNCTKINICGNDVIDPGEECDMGMRCQRTGRVCTAKNDGRECEPGDVCHAPSRDYCSQECKLTRTNCQGLGESASTPDQCCSGLIFVNGQCSLPPVRECASGESEVEHGTLQVDGINLTHFDSLLNSYRNAANMAIDSLIGRIREAEQRCSKSGQYFHTSLGQAYLTPERPEVACRGDSMPYDCRVHGQIEYRCCFNKENSDTCTLEDGTISQFDRCRVCGGDGTSCIDCSGVVFGNSTIDECRECGQFGVSCACAAGHAPNGPLLVSDEAKVVLAGQLVRPGVDALAAAGDTALVRREPVIAEMRSACERQGGSLAFNPPILEPKFLDNACVETVDRNQQTVYTCTMTAPVRARCCLPVTDPSQVDCRGISGGGAKLDECGVCDGDGMSCRCPGGMVASGEDTVLPLSRIVNAENSGIGYDAVRKSILDQFATQRLEMSSKCDAVAGALGPIFPHSAADACKPDVQGSMDESDNYACEASATGRFRCCQTSDPKVTPEPTHTLVPEVTPQ